MPRRQADTNEQAGSEEGLKYDPLPRRPRLDERGVPELYVKIRRHCHPITASFPGPLGKLEFYVMISSVIIGMVAVYQYVMACYALILLKVAAEDDGNTTYGLADKYCFSPWMTVYLLPFGYCPNDVIYWHSLCVLWASVPTIGVSVTLVRAYIIRYFRNQRLAQQKEQQRQQAGREHHQLFTPSVRYVGGERYRHFRINVPFVPRWY